MGIFLTYSDKNEIAEVIHSFIKEESNLKVVADDLSLGAIVAKGKVSKKNVNVLWNIESYGNSNSVRMKISPEKSHQVAILFRTLFFIVMLGILPAIFSKYWTGTVSSQPILKIALIILIISGFLWINDNRYKDVLNKLESKFRTKAKANIGIKIESPPDAKLLPISIEILIKIALTAVLLFVAYKMVPLLFYAWLPFMGLSILYMLLSWLAHKEEYLIWKTLLVSYVFKWILIGCSIIFFFFVIYLFNSYYFISYENVVHGNNISFKKVVSTDYFLYSIKEFKKQPSNSVDYKLDIINEAASKTFRDLDRNPTKSEVEALIRKLQTKTVLLGLFAILLSFFAAVGTIGSFLKIPDEWKLFVAEGKPTSLKPPAVSAASKLRVSIFYFLLALWVIFGFVINIIFVILSIDIIHYLIFNNTYLIKELSALISWIPTISILIAKLGGSPNDQLFVILPKVFLLFLSMPFIYVILRWIYRIFAGLKYRANKYSKGQLPQAVKKGINDLSKKQNVNEPNILIVESKDIFVETRMGLFSKRATIVINRDLINKLSENELIAIIAHELSHIKYDLRKIAALKFLSKVTLFPNFFLTIFSNYQNNEERADKYSIEVTKMPADLKTGLIKISTWTYAPTSTDGKNIKAKKRKSKYIVMNEFFFGEALIGYSHPEIIERLKGIEKA